jgi:hypothetical protein
MTHPPTPPSNPYDPQEQQPGAEPAQQPTGQTPPAAPGYPTYPDPSGSPYATPAPDAYGAPQGGPAPYPTQPQSPYGTPAAAPYGASPYAGAPQGGYGYFPRNDLGIWALVLGIASIVLSCGPFTGIPAIIVGSKAKKAVEAGEANNGGMALAGVILGWVGTGLFVLLAIAFVAIFAFAGMASVGIDSGYY